MLRNNVLIVNLKSHRTMRRGIVFVKKMPKVKYPFMSKWAKASARKRFAGMTKKEKSEYMRKLIMRRWVKSGDKNKEKVDKT